MRILQINTYYDFGSTGSIVKDLYDWQVKNNFDAYVIFGRKIGAQKFEQNNNIFYVNKKNTFYMTRFLTYILGERSFYLKKNTKRIISLIDKINPDIVHLHNMHGYYINIKILFDYLKEKKIPVVWTFHDCWPFTGHCAHFHEVNCEKWKVKCEKCVLKRSYPKSLIFDTSEKQYRLKRSLFNSIKNLYIITVSNWLNNLVQQSFLKEHKIKTIYNWIDTDVFYPRESNFKSKYGLNNKKIILGVASVWTKRKGLDDFIKLAKLIDDEYIIVLVGKKSKIKLPDNIIWINNISSREKLAEIYSSADVFVNASVQETFGLTTAEALACGTPSIVYNITACPEVLGKDGFCGDVVEKSDISSLYKSIKKIIKNGKEHYRLNCIKRVNELFNKEVLLNEYISIYKRAYYSKETNE